MTTYETYCRLLAAKIPIGFLCDPHLKVRSEKKHTCSGVIQHMLIAHCSADAAGKTVNQTKSTPRNAHKSQAMNFTFSSKILFLWLFGCILFWLHIACSIIIGWDVCETWWCHIFSWFPFSWQYCQLEHNEFVAGKSACVLWFDWCKSQCWDIWTTQGSEKCPKISMLIPLYCIVTQGKLGWKGHKTSHKGHILQTFQFTTQFPVPWAQGQCHQLGLFLQISDFSHGHRRRRALSFRLCLTQEEWWRMMKDP